MEKLGVILVLVLALFSLGCTVEPTIFEEFNNTPPSIDVESIVEQKAPDVFAEELPEDLKSEPITRNSSSSVAARKFEAIVKAVIDRRQDELGTVIVDTSKINAENCESIRLTVKKIRGTGTDDKEILADSLDTKESERLAKDDEYVNLLKAFGEVTYAAGDISDDELESFISNVTEIRSEIDLVDLKIEQTQGSIDELGEYLSTAQFITNKMEELCGVLGTYSD